MARYPDSPRPNTGYAFRSNWPVVVGGPEWSPQSRALTRFNLAEADLTYTAKTWAQIKVLYDFFESVKGSAGRFTFADFNGIGPIGGTDPGVEWSGLYVAKGDGVTTVFDLPTFGLKVAPAAILYHSGSVATSNYTIGYGTGTDGVDKATASVAPAIDVIVTIDGTCRRAFRRAKFLNVKNPFVFAVPAVYSAGPVNIVEVRK